MKKIALIEYEPSGELAVFDKVISFSIDDRISTDNYITEEELSQIYDKTFLEVNSWLLFHRSKKNFSYNGIDILWVYGREIFEFILNIYRKLYIAKKIIEEEAPAELWIARNSGEFISRDPALDFFLGDFIPSGLALKFLNKGNLKYIPYNHSGMKERPFFLESITKPIRYLPDLFKKKSNSNALIRSDLNKMLTILNHLDPKRTIFVREDLPERLILYFLKKGINLVLFSDFRLSSSQIDNAVRASKRLIELLEESLDEIKIENLKFTPYLKKYLYQTWHKELPHLLNTLVQIQTLFKEFKIKSLLLDEDRTVIANLLAQVSRQNNASSYVNCHGEPFFNKIGYLPLTADHIFAWGIEQKNFLQRWGLEKDRIIVSGSIKHDRYLGIKTQEARKKICNDLMLSKEKTIVLFGWGTLKKRHDLLKAFTWQKIKQSINIAAKYLNIHIIIKMHPGDPDEELVRYFVSTLKTANIRILKDYDPLLLAKGCDCLVIYSSTFAIDGLAYGKPVILLDNDAFLRYKSLKYFYDGTTEEGFKKTLSGIISSSAKDHITNWKQTADYCLNGMDGLSSERIAKILSG